ncbi:MAG: VWA domain-containing protein, partial [Sandaracinaceae bacterium]
ASKIPWIAFLLSLLAALLFVGEIGDPRFGRGVRGTTVIVLDAGSSMGATFGSERRIDRAIREVRRWVDRTTASGRVAVVRAGMRPEALLALTEDPSDLERALAGFELDDGPADLRGALRLADRIIQTSGDPGQILVVADEDVEDAETVATRVLIPVGFPADTIAIADFTGRRDPGAAGEFVVHVQVQSFSSREASARLTILDGEVPLLDRNIDVRPGEGMRLSAQGFSAERAELTARLSDVEIAGSQDALPLDDVAYAVVPALEPLSVLLVTDGSLWLTSALAVHPNATVDVMSPADWESANDSTLSSYDVLLLDRVPLREGLQHPAVVLFAPEGGQLGGIGLAERPRISAFLASHPALNGVRMDGARIGVAQRLPTEAGDQVLIRSGSDAIAVARQLPGRRILAYGINLGFTDLVHREAFPLLVHQSLRWAAAVDDELPLPRRLGEPIYAAGAATVLGPDGEPVDATELAAIRRQGIYHVDTRAEAFSATVDARELPNGVSGGRFRNSDPLPPLAILVAGALMLLMLLEWTLLHRGRIE